MSGFSPTPAEQHLGDRLAALVDGELKHDARDRVLAHLATCSKCKAEADAQRRLKDVFARSAPPSPSEGLLARLQGLPAGPGGDSGRGGPFDGGRVIDSVFGGVRPPSERPGDPHPETFGYVPGGHTRAPALPSRSGGFRIHEVGRQEAERSPWRGRRFAFAAASAVSLAAIALGGSLPLDAPAPTARGTAPGNAVTPMQAQSSGGATGTGSPLPTTTSGARGTDHERRRGAGQAPARSDERVIGRSVTGPLTPGNPLDRPLFLQASFGDLFAPSPLIRPTGQAIQLITTPSGTPQATPAPTHLVAPVPPSPPLASTR
ncbi:zf-HC2 domain-containing protein [Streptomyces sp. NPDC001985]|uniref:zf-HC2 domain-containing protein n=1 Tax=Streptomyces sp. NPDC001985 TaxID=3154406 RepID=UPI00331B13C4